MSKDHLQLTAVTPSAPFTLHLTYADGEAFAVDLQDWIAATQALKPLHDAALFATARLGVGGRSVGWPAQVTGADDTAVELDLGADKLRNLAVEQTGGIGHERIWNWLHDTGLTLEQAAQALGLSRRMLIYYRDGEKPIPRSVWLACLGWEAIRPTGPSLPRHIPSVREYAVLHG